MNRETARLIVSAAHSVTGAEAERGAGGSVASQLVVEPEVGTATFTQLPSAEGERKTAEQSQQLQKEQGEGAITPAMSLDTYTFNFRDMYETKTQDEQKAELKRSIQKGAKYNIKMNAKYQAAQGYGFKGAMSLKQVVALADDVAEKKLSGKTLTGAKTYQEKKLEDRTHLLKFRAGVDGRKHVQE